MDFSSVCLDGMLGSSSKLHVRSASEMDLENPTSRDQNWRISSNSAKMARTESYIPALMRTTNTSVMSDASRMETTTTTTTTHNGGAASDLLESADHVTARLFTNKTLSLPFYHPNTTPTPYQYSHKSAGAGVGLGVHGMLARMSPFTASQWQELEHQALIFRYIMAGVHVPPELLLPIRKTNMNINLFSNLSGVGSLRPNMGWSSFNIGFGGGNADPEPGRCRRTDGKKWRCSRDAVPDQKYCERHMNRGRHRSRKPVEGQTQSQTIPTTASGAVTPISSATSLAAARSAVTPNTTTTNTSSFSNIRPSQLKPSTYSPLNATATATATVTATPFQIPLNVDRYLFDSATSFNDGGAWRASRMVAPPKTTTNLMGFDAPDFGLGCHMNHHDERRAGGGIRHFFDDWPMRSAAPPSTTTSATATQLSISIPSDFTLSSPNNKLTLSPLKLSTSRSDDPLGVDVALGVGMGLAIESEHSHRQPQNNNNNNWIPIAWESPMGGPLAEVLNSTPHEKHSHSSSSVLNLMTGDATWDCSSPRGDTSPTGVLQKTLGSLSDNSSTGSSPRALKCDNLRTAVFAQLSNT